MSQTKYLLNNIEITYYGPDSGNVLLLKPTKKANKQDFLLLKNQIETNLQVDSIKTQKQGISVKLNNAVQETIVGEYLRALGAAGGEQIEDAASLANQTAEDNVEEQQQDMMQQQQMQPAQTPQLDQQQLAASYNFGKLFNMLYEKSLFKPKKVKKKASLPGRRTGKYWMRLEKALGKNRQKILDKDVLVVRSRYNKKPESNERNEVLKATDKAFSYFHRRLKEDAGPGKAERFAKEFYALDNLQPSDYSGEPNLENMRQPEENSSNGATAINGQSFMDLSDMFKGRETDDQDEADEDEETYDDIEVEEDTF